MWHALFCKRIDQNRPNMTVAAAQKKTLPRIGGHHPVPSLSSFQQRDGYSNVLPTHVLLEQSPSPLSRSVLSPPASNLAARTEVRSARQLVTTNHSFTSVTNNCSSPQNSSPCPRQSVPKVKAPPLLPANKCPSLSATARWVKLSKVWTPNYRFLRKLHLSPEPAVLNRFRPAVLLTSSSASLPPGASQGSRLEASNNIIEILSTLTFSLRNVTVPNVTWKEECRTVNQTLPPRQKTIYVKQNVTKSHRICNKVYKEETFNYTMPKYEVIKTNRSEKVRSIAQCHFVIEKKYSMNLT